MAVSVYTFTSRAEGFFQPCFLTNIGIVELFNIFQPSRYRVITYHYCLSLSYSDYQFDYLLQMLGTFFVFLSMKSHVFAFMSFSLGVVALMLLMCRGSLYILDVTPAWFQTMQIASPILLSVYMSGPGSTLFKKKIFNFDVMK